MGYALGTKEKLPADKDMKRPNHLEETSENNESNKLRLPSDEDYERFWAEVLEETKRREIQEGERLRKIRKNLPPDSELTKSLE
ncbi:hypothetical protein [Rudanella lutea]|uniref:hypothetical protein n=1 Tax=Rudanella lutea TaxID=451374 RepID=UPI0012FCEF64|nr:hypothetical protein [Rudanella lutea]